VTTRNISVRLGRLPCCAILCCALLPAAGPQRLAATSLSPAPLLLPVPALAPPQHDKPYALIFGTVWGPDDRPVYGVRVKIRRATDKPKKVRWEVYSDHHGEFAQRVPVGELDYILSADLKGVKFADGTQAKMEKEVTVHIYNDEREDVGLHLTR
jgi:hypothetical protein